MWKNWIDNNLFNKNGKINASKVSDRGWFLSNHPLLYNKVIDDTNFLSSNTSLLSRIYCLYNGIAQQPKCKYCGKPVKFISFTKGFAKYCSKECVNKSSDVKKKVKLTKLMKFGNENYNNRNKSKDTCLKKYNTKTPAENINIKNKTKQTNLRKYGVEWYTQTKKFQQKSKKYSIDNYNVENINRKHIKNLENLNKKYIENNFIDKDGYLNIKNIQDYYNISISLVYKKLKEFNINYNTPKSQFENEIYNFLSKYVNNIIKRDKTTINPYELDFFLPDYKLAIEFNGNYYHSYEKLNDKYYHQRKTDLCESKNILLIHIFQYQWENKQDIIKSIILSKLGIFKNKIYARKCKVIEVSNKDKSTFLNNNHLQGKDNSSIKLGLYYGDELVSLMTFGKRKISGSKSRLEMIRFCNKINTQVIGGASKLFKYFINNYWNGEEIISFADRQYSNGNLYKNLKFKFVHNTNPNYFYYKGNNYLSRIKCQKHKLNNIIDYFDSNLSEYQNMIYNGYKTIYNSGNKLYKYS